MRAALPLLWATMAVAADPHADLRAARDRGDRAGLQTLVAQHDTEAKAKPADADAAYRLALAQSYLAEVAQEQKDKRAAGVAAEAGIQAAQRAVGAQPRNAEYHRVLGTLCGQLIPANVLAGLKYGRCAMDEISRAIELDPKSAPAHLSRGVGNYYLPSSFGGGPSVALKDFERAVQLDPKNPDAQLWLGIAQRETGNNADARRTLERAVALNPRRAWARQQLEKTPRQ